MAAIAARAAGGWLETDGRSAILMLAPFLLSYVAAINLRSRPTARSLAAFAAAALVTATAAADGSAPASLYAGLLLLSLVGAALGEIVTVRVRTEIALRRAVEGRREAELERTLADERVRLARELHDTAAQSMSAIGIQARAAEHALPPGHDRVAEALRAIGGTSSRAIEEMRRVLLALRAEDSRPAADAIGALAERVRATGGEAEVDAELRALPPSLGNAILRIADEAVVNAAKHAPGQPLSLRLRRDAAAVHLEVRNPLGSDGAGPGTGLGLRGMRERAAMHGGDVAAGSQDGAWVVRATFPTVTIGAAGRSKGDAEH